MNLNWKTEWPHWLVLAGIIGLAAASWSIAPDRIPVHWNIKGEVDRYGGRFEGILLLPIIAIVMYGFLLAIPRIDPGRANYAGFPSAFGAIRLAALVMLAGIAAITHLTTRGVDIRMNTVMPLLIGGLFLVIGNVMGKLRPNWFVGIRTPWTLSSKRSWSRTHRIGGRVFVGVGFLMMVSGILSKPWAFLSTIILLVAASLGLAIYSYFVWKNDPDKTPPAGTSPA